MLLLSQCSVAASQQLYEKNVNRTHSVPALFCNSQLRINYGALSYLVCYCLLFMSFCQGNDCKKKNPNIPELQQPPAKSHAFYCIIISFVSPLVLSFVFKISHLVIPIKMEISILQVVFLLVIFIILLSCHTITLFVTVSLLYCIQDKSFSHSRQDGDLNIASCFFH